jgi:hypothetical protein
MKTPNHIRRKRRLEVLGGSRLLRRLTHQARVLNHGAHGSIHAFAKRFSCRYETFLQLILSRWKTRPKLQTALQFTFRLLFYIQNIENKLSSRQSIYSSVKNIHNSKNIQISWNPKTHYGSFISTTSQSLTNRSLLYRIEYIHKYSFTSENLTSNTNKLIESRLIDSIVSISNKSGDIYRTEKSLYHQSSKYQFALSENYASTYILTPSQQLDAS